ncbi:MAG: hypothetical protein PHY29_03140, partial [Syntrophales bacterium]|nr:hypothetical protein [Syntrophales bacterium]
RKLIIISELPSYKVFEEQKPRLLAAGGRMIVCLTAIDANYMYEELYENAKVIVRTPEVVKAYKTYLNKEVKKVEKTDSPYDIGIFQAATDDNPIWAEVIRQQGLDMTVDEYISTYIAGADPDLIPMRRYGIMKQIGGAIFKDLQWDVHWLSMEKYFPSGVPYEWRHGRMIDFHELNPWAVNWIAHSPDDEIFVYREYDPSPEKDVVMYIAHEIAEMTGDVKSSVDLIDPLAAKNQPSVGVPVVDDLNRHLFNLKRDGIGTGGYFQSWDTKSQRGRDELKKRLKNARDVGRPFNNKVVRNGRTEILPTIWIMDTCRQTALSLKNWRTEEHKDQNAKVEKDPKEKPQQKWSHHCMCLEAALKHPAFQRPPRLETIVQRSVPQAKYGQGARR